MAGWARECEGGGGGMCVCVEGWGVGGRGGSIVASCLKKFYKHTRCAGCQSFLHSFLTAPH